MQPLALIIGLFIITFKTSHAIFPNLIGDFLTYYGKNTMVYGFSCNSTESYNIFKVVVSNGHKGLIIPLQIKDPPIPIPPQNALFVLNMRCKSRDFEKFIEQADKKKFFAQPYRWLLYFDDTTDDIKKKINATFFDKNILIDSDINIAFMENNDNYTVTLNKIYKRRREHKIIYEYMGFWTESKKIVETSNFGKITAVRRRNLNQMLINTCIVITNNNSLQHLTDKRNKHIDSIAKVNFVLGEHLSTIINATFNYTIKDTWGYKNKFGKWSGMIGELIENRVDIGGTPLFLTIDRVDIIEYIAMTTPTRSKFVFREPKLSYVTDVYTLPFDNFVWYCTIALVIFSAFILFVAIKWEYILKEENYQFSNEDTLPELQPSVSDVAFLSIGAVCQQGAAAVPFSLPGRITTIFLYIALFFLYTSYSANIVALLQSSSHSINNLEDLLKSRLQVGVDDTVFNRFYFPNATEKIRRQIYLQKVAPPGKPNKFMPIEEGIRKMRGGLFAFHVETGAGYKLVGETFHEDEKCGLQEIQFLQVPDPWLAIRKYSSFKEILKIGLKRIQEVGLQIREVGLIYSKKPACLGRGTSFISFGIVDCYPPVVVLACGLIVSFNLLLVEMGVDYMQKVWRRRAIGRFNIIPTKN